MMKNARGFLIVLTFVLIFLFPFNSHSAITKDLYKNYYVPAFELQRNNGEFIVYIVKDNSYKEAGKLSFNKYFTQKDLDLSKYVKQGELVNIILSQKGGGASHIDSISLGGKPPVKINGNENGLKKLSKKDFDVIDSHNKSIKISFNNDIKDYTLSLTARIEETIISKTPFRFPIINTYKPITDKSEFYKYSLNSKMGKCLLDGNLNEIKNWSPFFKEYSISGTGHPSNYTYGWVYNDDKNLYVAIDFTGDNTKDGEKDYAEVHIKTDEGIKNFRVSEVDKLWGKPGFLYTERAGYQHKVYEFKIPLNEIFSDVKNKSNEIQIAFSTYGTDAPKEQYYYYEALIDSDNNVSTGGTVHVKQKGSEEDINGIDYIVTAYVTYDEGFYIDTIVTQRYNGSAFVAIDINDTDYPINVGNGVNGATAIEFLTSRANLNNPTGTMKIVYHASISLANDYTSPFYFQQGLGIPALNKTGFIILSIMIGFISIYFIKTRKTHMGKLLFLIFAIVSIATFAWAATITIDGNVNDWNGINSSVTDPEDDSSIDDPLEDIIAGFMTSDSNNYYFRMDINVPVG